MLETFLDTIKTLWEQSAFCNITWQQGVMLLISFFLMSEHLLCLGHEVEEIYLEADVLYRLKVCRA